MIITVVIPCFKTSYKTTNSIIDKIPSNITNIIVVDDKCTFETGKQLAKICKDKRLKIIYHTKNKGVGGAVISGYRLAIKKKSDIIIKLDGDGQMDPLEIHKLLKPILNGEADYSKGNRLSNLKDLRKMPTARLIGNFIFSVCAKFTTGYWDIFDFSNGFTAIKGSVLKNLITEEIDERFFFETDMLFHLYIMRAKVVDVSMKPIYGDEKSNLNILKVARYFPLMMLKRFFQRIKFTYFIMKISFNSLGLLLGLIFLFVGLIIGIYNSIYFGSMGEFTPNGIIMTVALNLLIGIFLLCYFVIEDTKNVPSKILSNLD